MAITQEHTRLIDHVSQAFESGIMDFENALTELVGGIIHNEIFEDNDPYGYCFDIYLVEPIYHYLKDFNLIVYALEEFRKQTSTEAKFRVIKHKSFAIIYVSHEKQP